MNFLSVNDRLEKALEITRQLAKWFDRYDAGYEGHPNVRISRTILCICVGEEVVWASSQHSDKELTFAWVMEEYRRVVKERYEPLEIWFNDRTTFTEDLK